ncbi:hypothetical protein [Arvimicrobium flavum]|uniref:hypothetical protein n=1 Tax=Arvimicrobium flavum TaxID=3393320 RepID=UPI00237A34AD|nr:hypothetical protein [Mesorhizobium shangrilense]
MALLRLGFGLFLLADAIFLIHVVLGFLLDAPHVPIATFAVGCVLSALVLPWLFGRSLNKDFVDLIYYTSAAIVAVAVFVAADFDRDATSTQRQIDVAAQRGRDIVVRLADLQFLRDNPAAVEPASERAIESVKDSLNVMIQGVCFYRPEEVEPRYGEETYDFLQRQFAETEKARQMAVACSRHRRSLTEIEKLAAGGAPFKSRLQTISAYAVANDMGAVPVVFREKGKAYPAIRFLELADMPPARLAAEIGGIEGERQQNDQIIQSLQRDQLERNPGGAPAETLLSSMFTKTIWPYILVALLSLKIARVPYIRKGMDLYHAAMAKRAPG